MKKEKEISDFDIYRMILETGMKIMNEQTPRSERCYIGFFGRTNSGKSSLMNALTGQHTAIVSEVAGTTTDVIQKNIELPDIGPCVLLDTAGFDDKTGLGDLRLTQTRKAAQRINMGILVLNAASLSDWSEELKWKKELEDQQIPVVIVLNKVDLTTDNGFSIGRILTRTLSKEIIPISAKKGTGIDKLLLAIKENISKNSDIIDLTGNLVDENDTVLLVMPQDIQAPKGRLILPQVQTIRNLLDKKCITVCCTDNNIEKALATMANPPKLIITDSQSFAKVEAVRPKESMLTSFSILFANYKGDIYRFISGARSMEYLKPNARILIAEACSHVPQNEDIGRVKLPEMLRKRFGNYLVIDNVSGNDFPEDLSKYDLIIHCAACMFTRQHVLNRVENAAKYNIPITNYGIAIAWLNGILDRVVIPMR